MGEKQKNSYMGRKPADQHSQRDTDYDYGTKHDAKARVNGVLAYNYHSSNYLTNALFTRLESCIFLTAN